MNEKKSKIMKIERIKMDRYLEERNFKEVDQLGSVDNEQMRGGKGN